MTPLDLEGAARKLIQEAFPSIQESGHCDGVRWKTLLELRAAVNEQAPRREITEILNALALANTMLCKLSAAVTERLGIHPTIDALVAAAGDAVEVAREGLGRMGFK